MLTGKQRSYLKSMANRLDPIMHIGKDGIGEGVINQLEELLSNRELVKVAILESADLEAKETAFLLSEKTGSEFVQAVGRRFVLYRQAQEPEKRKIHIPYK